MDKGVWTRARHHHVRHRSFLIPALCCESRPSFVSHGKRTHSLASLPENIMTLAAIPTATRTTVTYSTPRMEQKKDPTCVFNKIMSRLCTQTKNVEPHLRRPPAIRAVRSLSLFNSQPLRRARRLVVCLLHILVGMRSCPSGHGTTLKVHLHSTHQMALFAPDAGDTRRPPWKPKQKTPSPTVDNNRTNTHTFEMGVATQGTTQPTLLSSDLLSPRG